MEEASSGTAAAKENGVAGGEEDEEGAMDDPSKGLLSEVGKKADVANNGEQCNSIGDSHVKQLPDAGLERIPSEKKREQNGR